MERGALTAVVIVPHPVKKKGREIGMVVTIPGGILAVGKGEGLG